MNYSAFDMNLLKVLSVLYEERNVTRAGERLGRTQSAISNSLRKLRETIGDPLFVRGPDGLVPTAKARQLEQQVHEIIRATDRCLTDGSAFEPESASGRFRLGAPDRLSLPVVLPFIETLGQRAPNIAVDVTTTDREEALVLLDSGQLDVATGWFATPPSRFRTELLFREGFVCLFRRGHPISKTNGPVGLDEILSYPHLKVSAAGDPRAMFDIMLTRIGHERHIMISVSNFTMVPSILRTNDMIGVFTHRVASHLAKEFKLATLPVPMEIGPVDEYIVWHNRNDRDEQQAWIREQIGRVVALQ